MQLATDCSRQPIGSEDLETAELVQAGAGYICQCSKFKVLFVKYVETASVAL